MPDTLEGDINNVVEEQMHDFCAAIGELILWASLIDTQLNKAILGMMALPEHVMIEPIVAQLDARPKAELLKKRAKTIPREWRSKITNWVERAEKANAKRNIVAHHGINISGDTITLHSGQLGKIMDSLDTSEAAIKPRKPTGIQDMREWIEQAKAAYEEGMTILANLDRFRVAALTKQAEPKS